MPEQNNCVDCSDEAGWMMLCTVVHCLEWTHHHPHLSGSSLHTAVEQSIAQWHSPLLSRQLDCFHLDWGNSHSLTVSCLPGTFQTFLSARGANLNVMRQLPVVIVLISSLELSVLSEIRSTTSIISRTNSRLAICCGPSLLGCVIELTEPYRHEPLCAEDDKYKMSIEEFEKSAVTNFSWLWD